MSTTTSIIVFRQTINRITSYGHLSYCCIRFIYTSEYNIIGIYIIYPLCFFWHHHRKPFDLALHRETVVCFLFPVIYYVPFLHLFYLFFTFGLLILLNRSWHSEFFISLILLMKRLKTYTRLLIFFSTKRVSCFSVQFLFNYATYFYYITAIYHATIVWTLECYRGDLVTWNPPKSCQKFPKSSLHWVRVSILYKYQYIIVPTISKLNSIKMAYVFLWN